jgi:hypothetical protein
MKHIVNANARNPHILKFINVRSNIEVFLYSGFIVYL